MMDYSGLVYAQFDNGVARRMVGNHVQREKIRTELSQWKPVSVNQKTNGHIDGVRAGSAPGYLLKPPDWSADFLIWLGGKRIGREGEIETLSGADLQEIEDRLHPHQNEDTDFARLLRWKLLPPSPALTSGR